VALAALVNEIPNDDSGRKFGSSVYDAEGIIRRLAPRLSARVVEVVQEPGRSAIALSDLNSLREEIAKAVQTVVDERLGQWKYAKYYKAEVVVTSLYLTDGTASVGGGGAREIGLGW
jgi:hypothetical protein